MGWVNDARRELEAGRQVQVRPFGGSMRGRIESGQLVTIAHVDSATVEVDDVVFVKWHDNYILHMVQAVRGDRVLIGNTVNKRPNGWVPVSIVIGKVIAVADRGVE